MEFPGRSPVQISLRSLGQIQRGVLGAWLATRYLAASTSGQQWTLDICGHHLAQTWALQPVCFL
eukprot:6455154-Amphidinium_carterae.1